MTYKLTFLKEAEKEWKKLPPPIQQQFKKKLAEILEHPKIVANRLSGMADCYKIKLRSVGYRLVYRVYDDRVVVQVIAVGKRDKSSVYFASKDRL